MENHQVGLILEDQESKEHFTLFVRQKDYQRAVKYLRFATELLIKRKAAIAQQSFNAISTNINNNLAKNAEPCGSLVPLKMFDEGSKNMYTLLVSPASRDQAINDLVFATNLLKEHKSKFINIEKLQYSETSTNQEVNILDVNKQRQLDLIENYSNEESDYENSQSNFTSQKDGTRCIWTEKQILLLLQLYQDNSDMLNEERQRLALEEVKLEFLQQGNEDRRLRRETTSQYRADKLAAINKIVETLESRKEN